MATYRIEVGREHGVQPKNIVGAIANESGLPSRLIGRINLFDAHSTVDLPDDLSHDVLGRLKRTWVCQQQLNIARVGADKGERGGKESNRGSERSFDKFGDQKPRHKPGRPDFDRSGPRGNEAKGNENKRTLCLARFVFSE